MPVRDRGCAEKEGVWDFGVSGTSYWAKDENDDTTGLDVILGMRSSHRNPDIEDVDGFNYDNQSNFEIEDDARDYMEDEPGD